MLFVSTHMYAGSLLLSFFQVLHDEVQKLVHFTLLPFIVHRNEACAFHYVDLDRQNDTLLWDDMFGLWHWKSGA